MQKIMLSVIMPTYNHESFIAEAIEGVLKQKTKYKYELLIGEDKSTDNTRQVIERYERQYPDIITAFYRDHNMHKEKIRNVADLRRRSQGKYIIMCEGDDFWTDENKIERQIDFLETHEDYFAVAHNCVVVNEFSEPNGEHYPQCEEEEYTFSHYLRGIMPGQLATFMCRNFELDDRIDSSIMISDYPPGDRRLFFMALCYGKVHCIQCEMSAYRHVKTHGSSYSANYRFDFNVSENWHRELLKYSYKIGHKQAVKCAEQLYYRIVLNGIKNKYCNYGEAIKLILGNVRLPITCALRIGLNNYLKSKKER